MLSITKYGIIITLYLYTLCDFWRKNAGGIRKTANQAAESSLAFADSHSLKVRHVSGTLILRIRRAALSTDWLIVRGVQKLHLVFFMLFKEHNAIIVDCMDYKYPQNW